MYSETSEIRPSILQNEKQFYEILITKFLISFKTLKMLEAVFFLHEMVDFAFGCGIFSRDMLYILEAFLPL